MPKRGEACSGGCSERRARHLGRWQGLTWLQARCCSDPLPALGGRLSGKVTPAYLQLFSETASLPGCQHRRPRELWWWWSSSPQWDAGQSPRGVMLLLGPQLGGKSGGTGVELAQASCPAPAPQGSLSVPEPAWHDGWSVGAERLCSSANPVFCVGVSFPSRRHRLDFFFSGGIWSFSPQLRATGHLQGLGVACRWGAAMFEPQGPVPTAGGQAQLVERPAVPSDQGLETPSLVEYDAGQAGPAPSPGCPAVWSVLSSTDAS